MEEGITIKRQTDELTGLTNIEVLDAKDRPTFRQGHPSGGQVIDANGKDLLLRVPTYRPSTSCRRTRWSN